MAHDRRRRASWPTIPEKLAEVGEELADVIGYSFALANELGLDVSSAIRAKMVKNAQKYPAEKYRGRYETAEDSSRVKPASCHRRRQYPVGRRLGGAGRVSTARGRFVRRRRSARASPRRRAFRRIRKASSIGCGPSSRRLGCTRARSRTIPSWSIKWRGSRRCWGNPGDVLARVRSPWELADALRSAGLLFPETRASADGLPRDGIWLAKTYHGASGSGVRVLRRGDRERGARSRIGLLRQSMSVYQQRIAGTPCAAVFVAADGAAALLGVTRQLIGEPWLGAHGFQYCGLDRSAGRFRTPLARRIEQLGNVLTEQFELTGLFGVDFILDGEQVWTLEVNPRYTASVEICRTVHGRRARSRRMWRRVAAMYRVEPTSSPRVSRSPLDCHGKATLFAKRDIVISPMNSPNMSLAEALRTPWPTLADVSPAGTPIEDGRPILTVFAERHATLQTSSSGCANASSRSRIGCILADY